MNSSVTSTDLVDSTSEPLICQEGLVAWILQGPLAAILAGLCLYQLATWIPHYLTWPFYCDHDTFTTMAYAWERGRLPYRDLYTNNFPGQIYMFWLLGKTCGWGCLPAWYAVDAALVVLFGAVLLLWSRRRFSRVLPGIIGLLTLLNYYLSLGYGLTSQRDWQGPLFAILGILVLQTWPGRASRWASALLAAVAVTIRPHVILLVPAFAAAIDEAARHPGDSWGKTVRSVLEWGLVFIISLALLFAPLVRAGVWVDFVHGVRMAAYGSTYSKATAMSFLKYLLKQGLELRVWIVLAAIALLACRSGPTQRRLAATWAVALLGVLLYKPLSPCVHLSMLHPLMLTWSINVALLVELILEAPPLPPHLRLVLVLLTLGMGSPAWPKYCRPIFAIDAISQLWRGEPPELPPLGYTREDPSLAAATYPWADYCDVLGYLRTSTTSETRLANMLKDYPALTGPLVRESAFPAESVQWVTMVDPSAEEEFARSLERTPNSVVVWAPNDYDNILYIDRLDHLKATVKQLYEPEARFGVIEIWRRKRSDQPPTLGWAPLPAVTPRHP